MNGVQRPLDAGFGLEEFEPAGVGDSDVAVDFLRFSCRIPES